MPLTSANPAAPLEKTITMLPLFEAMPEKVSTTALFSASPAA